MRLARNVLEGVAGLEIFPIIGIVIFMAFFFGLIVYVVRMSKEDIEDFSKMPLTDEEIRKSDTLSDSEKSLNKANNKS